MRPWILVSFSRAMIAAAALAAAGCGAANDCANAGRDTTCASTRPRTGADTEFACPGYGPANRCRVVTSYGACNRGVTNMQPGGERVPSINPVLPYSTDDNNPNLLYETGYAGAGGAGAVAPAPFQP